MEKTYNYQKHNDGFALVCGEKPMTTPQGRPLVVPTEKLAAALAAEWQSMGPKIKKDLLRYSPLAYVAIDIAQEKRTEMLVDLVPYIDTDLVCYRAGDIDELYAEQHTELDPLIDWIGKRFSIKLATTAGLMPVVQPEENSVLLREHLMALTAWQLAAFAVALKPLGSAVLALALLKGRLSAAEAFRLAHLEESYETGKWGEDEEKEKFLNAKRQDLQAVAEFLALL